MPEENNTPAGGKLDMVDRKAAWIERMFDRLFAAISKDVRSAIIVVLVGWIIWQQTTINEITNLRIADITTLNEKINKAVEARVDSKVNEKMAPIKAEQEDRNKKLDTSLNNFDATVEAVKDLVTSKKRKK